MFIGIALSLVRGGVRQLRPWILAEGIWNDLGEWYDSATWNDGVGTSWILAEGIWNDLGDWYDTATWNDGV